MLRSKLTYSNVMSTLAVFLVLGGGTAYAANTISSADIVDDSIRGSDIKDRTVNTADLARLSVASDRLLDGAVTLSKLATDSVDSGKLVNNSVRGADVKDATLTGDDVADTRSLGPLDVGALDGDANIIDNTISTFDIGTNAVDSDEVLDFGLSNEDVGVLYALVNGDGTLASASSGAVSSARLSDGQYEVGFGHDVSECALTATIGATTTGSAGPGFIDVAHRTGNAQAAFVRTSNPSAARADLPYHLVVVC